MNSNKHSNAKEQPSSSPHREPTQAADQFSFLLRWWGPHDPNLTLNPRRGPPRPRHPLTQPKPRALTSGCQPRRGALLPGAIPQTRR